MSLVSLGTFSRPKIGKLVFLNVSLLLLEPHILLFRRPVNFGQQLTAQDQNQVQAATTVH